MPAVVGADNKPVPDGHTARPIVAVLSQAAAIALTTPTVATTVTDADGWAAGPVQVLPADGGITVGVVAGTFTIGKAGLYRAAYGQSEITVVNGQVITLQLYKNAAAAGGISKSTQLTAAPLAMSGEAFIDCAAGDVITLKVIASTGNYTSASGFITVVEV